MHAPERRSNSQPWRGHVTMSPSTQPSQRAPPWWGHSLPMARISSPRRKSTTSSRPTATRCSLPFGTADSAATFCFAIRNVLSGAATGRAFGRPARRRLRVRLVEDLHDVLDLDAGAARAEALRDLDDATRVRGDHRLSAGGDDVGDLPLLKARGHLRLRQVVGAGGATAPVGLA